MMTSLYVRATAIASITALFLACGGRTGDEALGGGGGDPGGESQGTSTSGSTESASGSTGVSGCLRGSACTTVTASAIEGAPCVSADGTYYKSGESWTCDYCGDVCWCKNGIISSPGAECSTVTYTGVTYTTATYTTATTAGSGSCYTTQDVIVCVHGTTTVGYTSTYTSTSAPNACYHDGAYVPEGTEWICPDGCNKCECLGGQVWSTTYYCGYDAGIGIEDAFPPD